MNGEYALQIIFETSVVAMMGARSSDQLLTAAVGGVKVEKTAEFFRVEMEKVVV